MTPRTVACQAPLSMGFPKQEYRSGLPFPPLKQGLSVYNEPSKHKKEGRRSFRVERTACAKVKKEISQDERMSESPVETLEKALGLHYISKMGLTCL